MSSEKTVGISRSAHKVISQVKLDQDLSSVDDVIRYLILSIPEKKYTSLLTRYDKEVVSND